MKNKIIHGVVSAGLMMQIAGAIAGKSAHPELMLPLTIGGAVIVGWFLLANKNSRQKD